MAPRSALPSATLRWFGLSVLIHGGALGLTLGTEGEPVDRPKPLVLRPAPAPLSLPDALGAEEGMLGSLEPIDWNELVEECDGRRFTRARPVEDCGPSGPDSSCCYGPDVLDCIGTPWTIGIGPSGEGYVWSRHSLDDGAGIVTLSPGEGTDGVFLVAGGPPAYPARAECAGLGGRVEVRVEVGEAGRTVRATVARSSGHADLDEAAARAARGWTWSHPGPWTGRVVVRFRNARRPQR